MPIYQYKGLDTNGKAVKGVREAPSKSALSSLLLQNNIYLSEAVEATGAAASKSSAGAKSLFGEGSGASGGSIGAFAHVSKQEIKDFTDQFCTLQKAAIPLTECLNALGDQAENPVLKSALFNIKSSVSEGSSLADAMSKYPKIFDNLYVNMIRAGESSGSLDVVLERLVGFLDSQLRLRSKIVSAMVYPIIMIVIGILLMIVLLVFVVPRVTKLFEHQRKELPGITKFLLFVTDLVNNYWFILLPVIGVIVFLIHMWKNTPSGREKWDTFMLRIPIIGNIVRLVSISRFSKTLATLLASGVPLLKAMGIVKAILGNVVLASVVETAHDCIREGETLAAPLKRSGQFPPLMTHMISVGERAGRLEEMLNSVADTYENQVSVKIEALTSLLEPLMIVLMGGTVGFVVFAILLPIMQLSDGFG